MNLPETLAAELRPGTPGPVGARWCNEDAQRKELRCAWGCRDCYAGNFKSSAAAIAATRGTDRYDTSSCWSTGTLLNGQS